VHLLVLLLKTISNTSYILEKLLWCGSLTNLKKSLRECLDYLAQNNDVMSQEGFKIIEQLNRPTLKQDGFKRK
jgi:hypothetical protein